MYGLGGVRARRGGQAEKEREKEGKRGVEGPLKSPVAFVEDAR